MAAAYCASTFFLVPLQTPLRFSRKSLFVLRCSATSPPLIIRLRKPRKNHLRPKILKTRPEPVLLEPSFTILEDYDDDIVVEPPAEYSAAKQLIEESLMESEPLKASVSDVNNVVLGKSSKVSVFKIGLFLVGAFVFQTICAVWVFGSGQNGILKGDDQTRVLELNGDGVAKSKILLNGNGMVYVDEAEVGKKISEIQAMARDVREKERREVKNSDNDGLVDDDDVVDVNRIEKEVIRRLEKLGKGVKKKSIKYVRKDNVGKEVNGASKAKYENPVISPIDNAKGFQSSDDDSIGKFENSSAVFGNGELESTSDNNGGVEFLESVQKLEKKNDDLVWNDSSSSEESDGSDTLEVTGKKVGKRKERAKLGKVKPLNGKVVKLDESNNLNGSSSPISTIDKDTSTIVHKDHSFRSYSESTKVKHKASNGVVYKNSVSQIDSWWLTLPYVLAIVMRTSGDDEEDTGLYTIKCTSQSEESSHVVAFEDRGDATNFCYLLQSFFQDMDDFSTDVIPIPIKELDEAVKSHAMKVIVVKKGQLGLYAGQPLSDVELRLQSMLE